MVTFTRLQLYPEAEALGKCGINPQRVFQNTVLMRIITGVCILSCPSKNSSA
jgi:hypothetical protein